MAVTYHAGRRIQGTQADFDGIPAVSGGWKELARTTLGSTSSTIDVSSIPDKRYYQVLLDFPRSGTSQCGMRINNDSGSNYSRRYTYNGASDSTGTSETSFDFTGNGSSTNNFSVMHIANLAGKEKLIMNHNNEGGSAGAGNIGDRREQVSKWANTSNALDQLTAIVSANNYASGAEMVVLGYDPDDTHTDNFWEELVDASGSGASFNTGTFTAKKYLCIQCWYKATGGGLNVGLQVGNSSIDTGSNYAWRSSQNGAADSTGTTRDNIVLDSATTDSGETGFANIFVVNNASNEKLFIISQTSVVATGAGTSPNRRETVAKWTDTSNQINIVGLYDAGTGGSFTSSSFIKVWGSN
jgi:hypothetical protein